MVGRVFGHLEVVKRASNRGVLIFWRCRCDCGNYKDINASSLTRKTKPTRSCGCSKKEVQQKNKTNIKGMRFGRLTVIEEIRKEASICGRNRVFWECKCDCGNTKVINGCNLRRGLSKSCGCLNIERIRKNLLGMRFGKLLVIEQVEKPILTKTRGLFWKCKCDCGREKIITSGSLTRKNKPTHSCGCLKKEVSWNPNLTNKEREKGRFINSGANKKWRKAVLEKYKGVCVLCGSKEELRAHHKNAWGKYKEQRYVVENGVVCCFKCHVMFHKIYGQGKNTEKQWDDFIGRYKNSDTTSI